jgi:hypothetical protein
MQLAHDENLAMRMRNALDGLPGLDEKKMMGGMCFLLDGNMVGGCHRDRKSGEGLFLFRVGKDGVGEALNMAGTAPMMMGGRRMGGFIQAGEELDDIAFAELISLSLAFVGTLPAK